MLYTVMPLERIYSSRIESSLIKSSRKTDEKPENGVVEYKDISLPHGKIHARRDGENYVVDGINSTDMSDYLNTDYIPGSIIK